MCIDHSIARRLRQERLLAGKTPEELARALRVDTTVFQAYENGELPIPAKHLAAAIAVLGVPLSLFAYEVGRALAIPQREPGPWHMVPRPLNVLGHPCFAQAQPVLKLWESTRGEMGDGLQNAVIAGRLIRRTILLRQSAATSRLFFEHFAGAITIMRPGTALSLVGREVDAAPDRDYMVWMSEAYARTAWDRRLRVESVVADIKTADMDTEIIRARYDRVLIPWQRRGDTFVLCLSLLRRRTVVA